MESELKRYRFDVVGTRKNPPDIMRSGAFEDKNGPWCSHEDAQKYATLKVRKALEEVRDKISHKCFLIQRNNEDECVIAWTDIYDIIDKALR